MYTNMINNLSQKKTVVSVACKRTFSTFSTMMANQPEEHIYRTVISHSQKLFISVCRNAWIKWLWTENVNWKLQEIRVFAVNVTDGTQKWQRQNGSFPLMIDSWLTCNSQLNTMFPGCTELHDSTVPFSFLGVPLEKSLPKWWINRTSTHLKCSNKTRCRLLRTEKTQKHFSLSCQLKSNVNNETFCQWKCSHNVQGTSNDSRKLCKVLTLVSDLEISYTSWSSYLYQRWFTGLLQYAVSEAERPTGF